MFIASFASGPWQANCYVVGDEESGDCVVIDPGVDAREVIDQALNDNHWTLVGVLATHGHVDHVASAAALANDTGVPLWMHDGDDFMLTDPVAGLGPSSAGLIEQVLGTTTLPAPDDRRVLADGDVVTLAGIDFRVTHSPGHSAGSVLFATDDADGPVIFTGDVVFAGSIGRTDLPGGDAATLKRSLRDTILPLSDEARLLPGHGPATLMGRERATNPYLRPSFLSY